MKKKTNKIQELKEELKQEKAKQVFVDTYSPGSFFPEVSTTEVKNTKDIKGALKFAAKTSERYGAKPFGFIFRDGNGKRLSGTYYITGRVFTRDSVPDTKENHILRCNMLSRPVCIENTNSYRYTGEFSKEDVVIDWDGNIIDKGSNYNEYRKQILAKH